jgi:hypothetical protein
MSFRNVIDALLIASATTTVCLAAETAGRSFATPEDAVVALIAAMRADDETAMRRVLGPDSEALIHSGDEVSVNAD